MINATTVPAKVTIVNTNAHEVTIPLYKVYNEVILPAGETLTVVSNSSEEVLYYTETLKESLRGLTVSAAAAETQTMSL